jgi:hypothetical protein
MLAAAELVCSELLARPSFPMSTIRDSNGG